VAKLTQKQIQIFQLIQRSPQGNDGGWAVSEAVWPLLDSLPAELIKAHRTGGESYGRVWLTEEGKIVVKYLI